MFEENKFYKYKGGINDSTLIVNIIYKCIFACEETATLELVKITNNKTNDYIIPVNQSDIKYFTKSGVQEKNWVNKNTITFNKIDYTKRREILIKETQITTSPHNIEKKGYVAYPDISEEKDTTFSMPTISYPPKAKFNDYEIQVNNPSHYNQGDISPINYIEANKLGFCEGNIIKYITRHKFKNGKEDVLKAIKYCEYILKYQYENN